MRPTSRAAYGAGWCPAQWWSRSGSTRPAPGRSWAWTWAILQDEVFWNAFLRSLKRRGLSGVQLVISDAHEGLKAAVAKQLQGAAWQRCKVHFQRNVLARIGKQAGETVNAMIRTIFAQPDAAGVRAQLHVIVDQLEPALPKIADMLVEAETDLTAFADFPKAHWRRIWSTNPLERVNKEIKRRTKVVGIFPDDAAIIRLVGAVLLDVHDEWQVADRAYFSETSMANINTHKEAPAELDAA